MTNEQIAHDLALLCMEKRLDREELMIIPDEIVISYRELVHDIELELNRNPKYEVPTE